MMTAIAALIRWWNEQRYSLDFTVVYVLTSTRSGALRICSVPALTIWTPLKHIRRTYISGKCRSHNTAIQPNLAESRQGVTHLKNNITAGYFSK